MTIDPRTLLPTVLHSPVRLAILGALRHVELTTFAELREGVGISAPELSRQLRVLEEESMIELAKARRDRHTVTRVRISDQGRVRFEEYLVALRQVVRDQVGDMSA